MPQIKLKIPHQLSQTDARAQLERSLRQIVADHAARFDNLIHVWNGQMLSVSFTTMGLKIAGTLLVESADVSVTATIPFTALLFKGRIEAEIREQLTSILNSPAVEQD